MIVLGALRLTTTYTHTVCLTYWNTLINANHSVTPPPPSPHTHTTTRLYTHATTTCNDHAHAMPMPRPHHAHTFMMSMASSIMWWICLMESYTKLAGSESTPPRCVQKSGGATPAAMATSVAVHISPPKHRASREIRYSTLSGPTAAHFYTMQGVRNSWRGKGEEEGGEAVKL